MTRNELADAVLRRLTNRWKYFRHRALRRLVREVVSATFDVMGEVLGGGEEVALRGFGSFRFTTYKARPGRVVRDGQVQHVTVPPQIRITFRPGTSLRAQLKEQAMEKYGVQTDDEKTKTASEGNAPCPKCGSNKVDYSANVPVCPKCGTEPWEPKK